MLKGILIVVGAIVIVNIVISFIKKLLIAIDICLLKALKKMEEEEEEKEES